MKVHVGSLKPSSETFVYQCVVDSDLNQTFIFKSSSEWNDSVSSRIKSVLSDIFKVDNSDIEFIHHAINQLEA